MNTINTIITCTSGTCHHPTHQLFAYLAVTTIVVFSLILVRGKLRGR